MSEETDVEGRLRTLKEKWFSNDPPQYPDEEFSVMCHGTELVYFGRYPEGVVLRLNDKEDHVSFLTEGMATDLARRLVRNRPPV